MTDTPMIERVARAIERSYDVSPDGDITNMPEVTRAAIEEMRDPSEGMRVAGEETSGYCVETFRAMINAALEGK